MRVLVFGDSITQGFWDVEGGWVSRLRKAYDQKAIETDDYDQPTIFNMGVSGNSSDDVLVRFDNETKVRANEELAFVFAIGVNDARTKAGVNFSDIERYCKNLSEIVSQARRYSDRILFVGLTPCVEARSNPVSWGDTGYTNARIEAFDSTLKEFCEQNSISFVEVLEPFQEAEAKTELLPDSLHPNNEGHQLIAELVGQKLQELLDETERHS
jgi:lysophospholipase L1-like esterase